MEITFESKFYERSIIFITVTALFLLIISVISDFLNSFDKNNPINFLYYIFTSGISLAYFLIFENNFSSKSKGANQIRFFIFFNILVTILCVVLRYVMSPLVIVPLSCGMFFIYSSIFEAYFYHDDFEEQCENKSGEKLKVELYHQKFLGEDALKSIKSLKNFLFIMNVICILFLCALPFISYKYSKLTFVFSLAFFAGSFSNILLLTIFQKEIYYAFMGFEKQWSHRKNVIALSFLLVSLALIIGFFISSGKSLITSDFLEWLKSLFHKEPVIIERKEPLQNFGDFPQLDFVENFPLKDLPGGKPNKVLEIILLIVEILLAGLAAFLVLWFLLRPFISKDFFSHLRQRNFKVIFRNFIDNFKEFLKKIFNFKFKKSVYSTTDSQLFKKKMNDFLKASKKSKEKKAELDRLTTVFVKLINWGSKYDIIYKKNLAPAEYTDKIIDYFRKIEETDNILYARKAGIIFEKALYSKDLLSIQEENDFKAAVNQIISTEY